MEKIRSCLVFTFQKPIKIVLQSKLKRKRSREKPRLSPICLRHRKKLPNKCFRECQKWVVKCRKSIINYWATRFSPLLLLLSVIATICFGAPKMRKENFPTLFSTVMSADAFWCDRVNHRPTSDERFSLALGCQCQLKWVFYFWVDFFSARRWHEKLNSWFLMSQCLSPTTMLHPDECRKWSKFKVM